MSSQQEINEINQLLAQIRNSFHAASGTAIGLMSDTQTSGLSQIGQKILALQTQVNQLKKENEELKKKTQKK